MLEGNIEQINNAAENGERLNLGLSDEKEIESRVVRVSKETSLGPVGLLHKRLEDFKTFRRRTRKNLISGVMLSEKS